MNSNEYPRRAPAFVFTTAALIATFLADFGFSAEVVSLREYSLTTPRSRDPVLGGSREKIFISVWIPDDVKVVRGAICNPFSKGDKVSDHWQAACRHWKFAYVQIDFDAVKTEEFDLLFKGLSDLASDTGHPELAHVPLCYIGMSRGGGISTKLAELRPERTIAVVPVCLEVGPETVATRRIPFLTIFGEKDGTQQDKLLRKLPVQRTESALWSIAVQWNRKHEFGQANNLSFVFFDEVISKRLPERFIVGEAIPLCESTERDGWLGDVGSWNKDGTRPSISAYDDYKQHRATANWFPSERTATVWQAFVSAGNDVQLKQPAGLGDGQPFVTHPADAPISVSVSTSERLQPQKLELWDGNRRLGERTSAPWEFEVRLRSGIHSLYAVAYRGELPEQCSRPHTILVTTKDTKASN